MRAAAILQVHSAILMDNPDDAGRISQEIDETFRNAPDQTRTESEKAFQLGFISMMGNVKMFLLEHLRCGHIHHHSGFCEHHGHVRARTDP